ncbi:enoyl-CoA hydratase/isomerase family protein [Novosphingobium sp. KCTC 2891]|uniref:enoyl-CoA hydratase/isomerase family protein n=1 Tax=Novosphingobium sp. KCTC 2891 TaxID=2989730 RepID=UPI0022212F38|nr:enoyl-CoA hydratase/isomerase family protein [Novosphingobium sp. KCTC 2891]MCW1384866.1 enoyl-CoA hydratase/isomerase family protein [Novosphingobium sp. KCTC 2891]
MTAKGAADEAALDIRTENGVRFITKINAATHYGISIAVCRELGAAIEAAACDPEVRAVVIDAGGRGFHRGAVMVTELQADMEALGDEDFRELVHRGQQLGRKVAGLPKPVIGLARSGALGGGLEQLLRCDFVFAREDARFSFPEVTLGFVAAWGGTQWAGRMMPMRRAQELLLLGNAISGSEAAEQGLITRAFADDAALDAHLADVLGQLERCSPAAFAQTKRCLSAIWEGPLAHGEAVELDAEAGAMGTGDFRLAYAAWMQGMTYNFAQGRPESRDALR